MALPLRTMTAAASLRVSYVCLIPFLCLGTGVGVWLFLAGVGVHGEGGVRVCSPFWCGALQKGVCVCVCTGRGVVAGDLVRGVVQEADRVADGGPCGVGA